MNKVINEQQTNKYYEGIKRLKQGEPLQYIIGETNFYGYQFEVNKNVLIPRFETELLVQNVLEYASLYFKNPQILDLGCGSGIIGITLKKEIPTSTVTCLDINLEALKLTKKNAKKQGVSIDVIKSNMLEKVTAKFDIIVSNPPYIGKDEEIEPIVFNNEPHTALFAENKGLYFYEQILKKANSNLKEKNLIAFEIGHKQASEIIKIAKIYFPNAKCSVKKDLTGRNRYIFILNI